MPKQSQYVTRTELKQTLNEKQIDAPTIETFFYICILISFLGVYFFIGFDEILQYISFFDPYELTSFFDMFLLTANVIFSYSLLSIIVGAVTTIPLFLVYFILAKVVQHLARVRF